MTDRPDLARVLTHYGIDVNPNRAEQLVCCPVHSDSKPSCSVNLMKEPAVWNCHACGESGDAWTVIMRREDIGYRAAIEFAEKVFEFVREVQPERTRVGLLGEPRPARGGYRPAIRRRPGIQR